MTMENYIEFSPIQYQIVAHILTLGAATMLAGLVYFLATAWATAPRYRLSAVLSAVVMASAILELGQQYLVWERALVFDAARNVFVRADGEIFSNGFRYMNWSIDVPVLLTQLLIVLGVAGAAFWRNYAQFVAGGLLMIWTGYAGQFYEAVDGVGPNGAFWIWGIVSTVFYLWILWVAYTVVFGYMNNLPEPAKPTMKVIFWLFVGSWTIYPIAYVMPAFTISGEGVVARQIIYTAADVFSKVIYGVLLTRVCQIRSEYEGFAPAADANQAGQDQINDAVARGERPQASRTPTL